MSNTKSKTLYMILCAFFAALIAVGAFLRIPVPLVPFTLQFFFTMLAGLLLGGRYGALSVVVYVLLGLSGLPVFANGGGIGYIFQPSFGYLIGFVFGAYATGTIAHKAGKLSYKRLLIANFTGLFIVYACGTAYCYLISNFYLGTGIALWPLFLYCILLPIPGDIVLCVLSIFLAKRLIPVVGRLGN